MFEKEIQQEIKFLNNPNNGNIKQSVLADDFFLDLPQYHELKKKFRETEYYSRHWKWHQLVRLVLEPQQTRQYMYDRLLSLLLKHRRSYDEYFILKTQEGIHQLPNPLADLNRLEILYERYFQIYLDIKNKIHFDYPKKEYKGPTIRGAINWNNTIQNSSTEFPIEFVSSIRQKEFETSENILLILCAEWLFRESSRLLQIDFKEPISEYNRSLLSEISQKTQMILHDFPFKSILNESKRYWNLSSSDPRIKQLEQKTKQRINQRLVRNSNYVKILEWIDDFRSLDISRVTDSTPTRHILDSLENVDTVYEAWIFLEFVEFLHEKGLLINLKLGDKAHCQFEYRGLIVTFWYEKSFSQKEGHAWILLHVPDFTAMVNDEILAIFDAKNYSNTGYYSESQNKMLAYMNNLDTSFGALIYPNYPKNWDDFTRDERMQQLVLFLDTKNSEATNNEIKNHARKLVDLAWIDLPKEYQTIAEPVAFRKFEHPIPGKKARFHFEQSLSLIRMPPEQSEIAINLKNQSLQEIFKAIVSRIPLIA
ncbi:hypothetical protein [Candidatus Nitrosarchaeum limnium]|jgi:hypothetical protein|uniref:Uncharacterized protein n=1 Tax=Candidatus Nitrosarchaeum limnium BG20 TaxID=859192 RepID=S2EIA4_9ARCH|nr:hypothetical protein [Candidatus Nitrosarchaeum limnium]EPA04487.1 hypothetical protein BG20_I1555 [Candidatus Nitrosarchaeum limnium BG20]